MKKSIQYSVFSALLTFVASVLVVPSVLSQTAPEVTALVTITNATQITNAASTFSVNGVSRSWTSLVASATSIPFTNNGFAATTNLLQDLQLYRASLAGGGPVFARTNATNSIKLTGTRGDTLAITFTPGYCSVTYTTNYYTNSFPLNLPFTTEGNQQRSNMVSGLVDYLNKYPTNIFTESAQAFSNFVSLTVAQTFGNKTITNSVEDGGRITNAVAISGYLLRLTNGLLYFTTTIGATNNGWIGALTNGLLTNVVILNPKITNGVLYGSISNVGSFFSSGTIDAGFYRLNGFDSLSYDSTTLQYGYGGSSIAGFYEHKFFTTNGGYVRISGLSQDVISDSGWNLGQPGTQWGTIYASNAVFAVSVRVTNLSGMLTNVYLAVANETVTNQNVLKGTLTNVNLAVANETVTNQNVLSGTSSNVALQNWTGTNANWTGSNRVNAIFFTRFDIASLGNSNNIAVNVGTNKFIRFTAGGLSAGANICGLVGGTSSGGADGQELDCLNVTGYNLVFSVNTIDPVAANRITSDSADITVINNGTINLKYNSATARWVITGLYPAVATATNAVAQLNGNVTNLQTYASAGTFTPLTVTPFTGSTNLGLRVNDTNSVPTHYVNSNGTFISQQTLANQITRIVKAPASPTTNIFEVQGASGEIAFGVNTNGATTFPAYPVYHVSTNTGSTDIYYPINAASTFALGTSVVLTNGNMRLIPFHSGAGGSLDSYLCNVVTAVGASNLRVGIYAPIGNTNFYPGALLTGGDVQFDSSITGTKITNLVSAVRLLPGRIYWLGTEANAAVALKGYGTSACIPVFGMSTNLSFNVALELVGIGYGAFPATCPLTNTIWQTSTAYSTVAGLRFNGL